MKQYRRFLFLLAILPIGTFAKDNFKMTGKIDGVGNDTLCIEYVIRPDEKAAAEHSFSVFGLMVYDKEKKMKRIIMD